MGHCLTSGDLVLGHSDLVVEHFVTPAKDNYKPYETVQILLKVKISAHLKISWRQIYYVCHDLEKRFKVK
jgi:hypothetical protein